MNSSALTYYKYQIKQRTEITNSSANKVSRCILKVFSPEVYTASFGGDVKPSVPGDLV